jgi:hypothetical protein
MFRHELKRILYKRSFYVSIVISYVCTISALIYYFNSRYISPNDPPFLHNAYEAWFLTHGSGLGVILSILIPIIVSLPYADSYIQDKKTKYLTNLKLRCNLNQYHKAKVCANMVVGASIPFVLTVSMLIITSILLPNKVPSDRMIDLMTINGAFSGLYETNPLYYVLSVCSLDAVFGGVYATFGLAMTYLFEKRIISVVAPFGLYLGLMIILDILRISGFNPVCTFAPYEAYSSSINIFIELLSILAISLLIIYRKRDNML